MDLPVTPAQVAAVAAHFRLPLYASRREGGFLRELELDGMGSARIRSPTFTGSGAAGQAGLPL